MNAARATGTTYVIILKGKEREGVRIGHHTSCNQQRETEVFNGSWERWEIVYDVDVGSKLKAAAVEAVAHVALKCHEDKRTARKRNKKGGAIRQQVFKCSSSTARDAIDAAVRTLKHL